jgi:hypothetical protein
MSTVPAMARAITHERDTPQATAMVPTGQDMDTVEDMEQSR